MTAEDRQEMYYEFAGFDKLKEMFNKLIQKIKEWIDKVFKRNKSKSSTTKASLTVVKQSTDNAIPDTIPVNRQAYRQFKDRQKKFKSVLNKIPMAIEKQDFKLINKEIAQITKHRIDLEIPKNPNTSNSSMIKPEKEAVEIRKILEEYSDRIGQDKRADACYKKLLAWCQKDFDNLQRLINSSYVTSYRKQLGTQREELHKFNKDERVRNASRILDGTDSGKRSKYKANKIRWKDKKVYKDWQTNM